VCAACMPVVAQRRTDPEGDTPSSLRRNAVIDTAAFSTGSFRVEKLPAMSRRLVPMSAFPSILCTATNSRRVCTVASGETGVASPACTASDKKGREMVALGLSQSRRWRARHYSLSVPRGRSRVNLRPPPRHPVYAERSPSARSAQCPSPTAGACDGHGRGGHN
jgi:hypothetical protein